MPRPKIAALAAHRGRGLVEIEIGSENPRQVVKRDEAIIMGFRKPFSGHSLALISSHS
jgi:hypothetical protein